ncbi:uncharacterized protein B0H18DRAFT_1210218 [Fomitopsis serialis]|uniref:uncharacterized protein n=1 Tax=Fomitopsis serialis TaxID=139415 RepID=UPI0020085688|nr:uncharacterized protein B0H18DRAFT_1210218 [Neoantrodia serialis]KAH9928712.1 hypothetical protein B0H18DRAFT_1210218 [Neoantrodia serialis]
MERTSVLSLPVELLYDIHIHAASPNLPLACKHLYAVCKSAPTSVHAQYLIESYHSARAYSTVADIISLALRYPVCTQAVLDTIIRSPEYPTLSSENRRKRTELPRRLFRNLSPRPTSIGKRKRGEPEPSGWTEDDDPLPFLRYLYAHPRIRTPGADSWEGYALTKAVHAEFIPLVQFLLEHGASPQTKGALAVMVAIRRKNLPLVRLLIERDGPRQTYKRPRMRDEGPGVVTGRDGISADSARGNDTVTRDNGAKRRKLGDRVQVNQEMVKTAVQSNARDIVEYFIHEKGCVPDMQTVLLMGASR